MALTGFVDGGFVDTLAVPSTTPGRAYTPLFNGGVGLVTRHQVPVVVSRRTYAADFRPADGRLAFRWQLSLAPSF